MLFAVICTAICARRVRTSHDHAWIMLGLASFVYFLGDLYWQLYMMFYNMTPLYSQIPSYGWYTAYFFLILMLLELRGTRPFKSGKKVLWLIPVFTIIMCIFYMQWGDYVGNIASVLLMTPLIWIATEGLMMIRDGMNDGKENRYLYMTVLFFCAAEYASWTASCFWTGDTITNAYFWLDSLISVAFLLLPPALDKAVRV